MNMTYKYMHAKYLQNESGKVPGRDSHILKHRSMSTSPGGLTN